MTNIEEEVHTLAIPPDIDPFALIADQEVGIEGMFLKFKGGLWRIGSDEEVVKPDARFAALVSGIQHGFVRWVDGKVESRVMVGIVDSLRPSRAELGDNDEADWPLGPEGHEDPWKFTYSVPLRSVEDDAKLVFSTSTGGGRRAVGLLCQHYSRQRRQVPSTQYPIVELGCDSYRNGRYGVVQRPILRIVEWISDATAATVEASNVLNHNTIPS